MFCIIVESNSQKTFSLLFLVYTNVAAVRHVKTLHNRPAVSGNDLSPNCFLWDDSREEQFQVNEGFPFLNLKTTRGTREYLDLTLFACRGFTSSF